MNHLGYTLYELFILDPLSNKLTSVHCACNFQSTKATSRVRMNVEDDGEGGSGEATIEKRTRFSLSHDEGSIGNTSDNLEAISEAASNHSVASSLDDVEQVRIVGHICKNICKTVLEVHIVIRCCRHCKLF